ncbi:MAG: O-methyltransferase [Ferruginibacter sp.]
MEIIPPLVEAYAKNITSPLDILLAANELDTQQNHPHAKMHSGHLQGKVLEMLSMMIRPLKILEIGTFTGFSALCLEKGLQKGGCLHTIELRPADAHLAATYFKRSDKSENITLHVGDAMEIIPTLQHEWDLVFLDADKINYANYYELTLPFIKPGGWLIADNVLFHGAVLAENIKEKNALAIHAFNKQVKTDDRVEQVLLTVRDGLLIVRKL